MLGRSSLVPTPLQRGNNTSSSFLFGGESGFETRVEAAWVLYWCIYTNLVRTSSSQYIYWQLGTKYCDSCHILCTERELLTDRARRFVFEVKTLSCASINSITLAFLVASQLAPAWIKEKAVHYQLEIICYQLSPLWLEHSVEMSESYFPSSSWWQITFLFSSLTLR